MQLEKRTILKSEGEWAVTNIDNLKKIIDRANDHNG